MAFNDIYRLRLWGRLHGQQMCNVYHFKENLPGAPGFTAMDLANHFKTNMQTTLRGRLSSFSGGTFEYIEVQPLVPYGATPTILMWTSANNGTLGQECHTGTLAEVLTLYTGQAGRSKRGRLYLWGGDTRGLFNGLWGSIQTTATTAFATALATNYVNTPLTSVWLMGVWSRKLAGPAPPYTTDAFAPVISITVRTTIRNQRRRQLGVGR